MGELKAIWLKRAKQGPMDAVSEASLRAGRGLVGNANQGGKRQVTLINEAVWADVTARLGVDLDPSRRRANLLVSGDIDLANSRHKVLRIGPVRVRIYGETRPCEQMEAAAPGLQEMLRDDWGGGAFGEVLDDGQIALGDVVTWEAD
jgi:MOSC domain-containing protein YiiM